MSFSEPKALSIIFGSSAERGVFHFFSLSLIFIFSEIIIEKKLFRISV